MLEKQDEGLVIAGKYSLEYISNLIESKSSENNDAYMNRQLYHGQHPILQKVADLEGSPNNITVNNYHKNMVDTQVGYFAGKPIRIQHNKSDELQDFLDDTFVESFLDDTFIEISKEIMIVGKTYMLLYVNEDKRLRFLQVPREEMLVAYKRGYEADMELAVRYFYLEDIDNDEDVLYVEVYTDSEIYFLTEHENGLIMDYSRTNPIKHKFKHVPVIEFYNNNDASSDFDSINSLVEGYNKIFSLSADENEGVRNFYLAITGGQLSDDAIEKMKNSRVLELPEGVEAKFIAKPANTEPMQQHLDRLELRIQQFSALPDLTDENFSSNASGAAISYKLLPMELKCIIKERKITKGIQQMLIKMLPIVKLYHKDGYRIKDFDILFVRNVPPNVAEVVDNVLKLNSTGLLDNETIIAQLPFIGNPAYAVLKKEEQDKLLMGEFTDQHIEEPTEI